MNRSPLPKKVIKKKSKTGDKVSYKIFLWGFNQMPNTIENADDIIVKLKSNHGLDFFRAALTRGNPARYDSNHSGQAHNKPINEKEKELDEHIEHLFVNNHATIDDYSSLLYRLVKDEITQRHYAKIRNKGSWLPTIISLKSTQEFIKIAAKYDKEECIKWVYALDRAIQVSLESDSRWVEYVETEISLDDNESIERAMDIFYNFVLSFIG